MAENGHWERGGKRSGRERLVWTEELGEEENEALRQLEARLQEVLIPVRPRPAFRRELRQRLLEAVERRQRSPVVSLPRYRWWERLLQVAVLGSAISVAMGAMAYFWRARMRARLNQVS